MNMQMFLSKKILFLLIFALAAFFRLYGTNWDGGQHFHPDERFLTMVTQTIEWPKTVSQYFDAVTSPLNPQNKGYSFFVYGLFPLLFVKFIAEQFNLADYANLTLVGRQLSGIVDLGTTILVFFIAKQLVTKTNKPRTYNLEPVTPFIAMFFYALSVLPIQLSHFYATDPYLTFFITLTFYFSTRLLSKDYYSSTFNLKPLTYHLLFTILMGISFGLALASKISGVLFLPIPLLFLLVSAIQPFSHKTIHKNIFKIFSFFSFSLFLFVSFSYLFLRIGSPYTFADNNWFSFTLNPKVVDNWKQLKAFDDPNGWFPPGVQWITTKPYIFPLKNMVLWGLGLPLGILSISSVVFFLTHFLFNIRKKKFSLILDSKFLILNSSLLWILLLFFYQGGQFVKALRYFYPLYPFLAILTGYFVYTALTWLLNKKIISQKLFLFFSFSLFLLLLIYPLSFMSIYTRPHTRVAASEWIYQYVPGEIYKSDEHWDDGLPVSLGNNIHETYTGVEFPLYGMDTPQKWQEMSAKLQQVSYIFLTSNRLYGSIMTVPERYPVTSIYYTMLFDGSLGFEKVAEFTSRPNLPVPFIHVCLIPPFANYGKVAQISQECNEEGISFVDDYADETFTVYDHPKVTIFKKVTSVDYLSLFPN